MDYSIIIPVYRSSPTLRELHARLTAVLQGMGGQYEIILVDDASPDDSWDILVELRAQDKHVKIIQHMRNFGQHRTLLCGLEHAQGEFAICMDDDLQNPPEEIPKLIAALRGNPRADVVYGSYAIKMHSWSRNLASRILNRITSYIFSRDPKLQVTSFVIIRRAVVRELANIHTQNPRLSAMLLRVTNRIGNTPVEHQPRKAGRSGYTLSRLVTDALDSILSNSSLPLQIVCYMGFILATLSALGGIYVLIRYFSHGITVEGWTTQVLLQLFFSGVLLFSIGIVGEYLIRILKETQRSSRSVIRQKDV